MNEDTNTLVADPEIESLESQEIAETTSDEVTDSVKETPSEPVEVMELPENVNPKMVDEIILIDPEKDDIMEEIVLMDTFQDYQRDIARDMRGFTSDYF